MLEANPSFTPSDVFENLVFKTILENGALRICSPEGNILKITPDILDRIEIPDSLNSEYFPNNYHYGDVYSDKRSIRWNGIPLFFERTYYTISLDEYRNLKKIASENIKEEDLFHTIGLMFELDPFWGMVEKFEGFSLCALTDLMPEVIESVELKDNSKTFYSKDRGRPSKKKEIKEFYEATFPNGHKSWKEVGARLLKDQGIDVHIDTIKRALGQKK
jgi:hypothetical protein